MTSFPNRPSELAAGLLPQDLSRTDSMQNGPLTDVSIKFQLDSRHYLARPTGFCLDIETVGDHDHVSLATCFPVQKNQSVNADFLRHWRAQYLDDDDAFHPSFLHEFIFCGAIGVHLESDIRDIFEGWNTIKVRFMPHLSLMNGPYYVKSNLLHSVWRIYEDRQLAFVQAIWPSIEDKR